MKSSNLYLISVFLFIMCKSEVPKIQVIYSENTDNYIQKEAKLINKINKIDNKYFTKIPAIEKYGSELFINNYDENQIQFLNDSFELQSKIGKAGEGPGEFPYKILHFGVDNEYVIVNNITGFVKFRKDGKYLETIKIEERCCRTKFEIFNGKIYMNINMENKFYSILDIKKKETQYFGNFYITLNNEDILNHQSNLVIGNEKLFAFCKYHPIVSIYDLNGKFISETNFKNHPVSSKFEDRLAEWKKHNQTGYPIWCKDIASSNGKLYALILAPKVDGFKQLPAQVICFNEINNEVIPDYYFNLDIENYYDAIEVNDDLVFVSSQTESSLHLYKMNSN